MKIILAPPSDIPANQLKDGEIAEITQWDEDSLTREHVGRIVQRFDNRLVVLGTTSGHSWPVLLSTGHDVNDTLRVRVLPKGTVLEI